MTRRFNAELAENAAHAELAAELGLDVYFARPYHAWGRGTGDYDRRPACVSKLNPPCDNLEKMAVLFPSRQRNLPHPGLRTR